MFAQLLSIHNKYMSALKPLFFRDNFNTLIDWNDRMIGISGSRGVGKTTLILQHIKKHCNNKDKCLYVSVDDVSFPYNSLISLADDFEKFGGEILYIDEIHKYPNWSVELKNIYDRYPDLKIVFSGSSLLHISSGNADLSRRAVIYKMYGLSFREFIQIEGKIKVPAITINELLKNHKDIAVEISSKIKPLALFKDYLQRGYYPFFLQSKKNYLIKLKQIFSETIERDIATIYRLDIEKLNKLRRFLFLISETVPIKINITELASSLGVNRTIVYEFLQYLSNAGLINLVYSKNKGYKALSKPEKVYLAHPNHYYALSDTPNIGSLRESFLVNQLAINGIVNYTNKGDFLFDEKYTFEVGGASKNFSQISEVPDSFLVLDNIEAGFINKIPLWMFGLLN